MNQNQKITAESKARDAEAKAQRKAEAEAKRANRELLVRCKAEAEAIAKRDAEAEAEATRNCAKVKANVLGSIAVDLRNTVNQSEYDAIMSMKARKHKTTVELLASALKPHLEKLPTGANGVGQIDGRTLHLGKVEASAFKACQFDNALLALDVDVASWTNDEVDERTSRVVAFVRELQLAKRELVELLHSTSYTASATQTYAYFVHSPVKNLWTDEDVPHKEFYLMSTGWDGKRIYPYYGVRMTPSDNRDKTKAVQYNRPLPVEVRDDGIFVPDAYVPHEELQS